MKQKGTNSAGLAVLEQAQRLNYETRLAICKRDYKRAETLQDRTDKYIRVAKKLFGLK